MRAYVETIDELAVGTRAFSLRPAVGTFRPFEAGSHVRVSVPGDEHRRPTPYSLVSRVDAPERYQIVVHSPEESTGTSAWLAGARSGDAVDVSEPRCGLPLLPARRHVFVAGGMGLTGFISAIRLLAANGGEYEIHYAVSTPSRLLRLRPLGIPEDARIRTYVSSWGRKLDLATAFGDPSPDTHVYVCGPGGLIGDVIDVAARLGWSPGNVHWDRYSGPSRTVLEDARLGRVPANGLERVCTSTYAGAGR